MYNNITQFQKCANCGACANICPTKAIYVDESSYFYLVKVNEHKCINCGSCVRVCPVNTKETHLDLRGAYGGWHNNADVVSSSSSGGAFTALADYVRKKDGVVFAAGYSDSCDKVVTMDTEETSLDNLRRSKYVESLVGDSFKKIKELLEKKRYVMFCGTPCQVAGLVRFLGKDYPNLITADFACGGLTSHRIYKDYLSSLEEKYKSRVSTVNFRAGLYGWKEYSLVIEFQNGRKYKSPASLDPYTFSFMYSKLANRENCDECEFRNNHYSDFSIADFWRWFEYSNLKNDETGISLILTNSVKAEEIIKDIEKEMHLEKLDINQAMYNCYVKPPISTERQTKRSEFFENYEKYGLKSAAILSGMAHCLKGLISKFRIVYRI